MTINVTCLCIYYTILSIIILECTLATCKKNFAIKQHAVFHGQQPHPAHFHRISQLRHPLVSRWSGGFTNWVQSACTVVSQAFSFTPHSPLTHPQQLPGLQTSRMVGTLRRCTTFSFIPYFYCSFSMSGMFRYANTAVTTAYGIQYSNLLYRLVPRSHRLYHTAAVCSRLCHLGVC